MKKFLFLILLSLLPAFVSAAHPFKGISANNDEMLNRAAASLGHDLRKCTPAEHEAIRNSFHLLRPGDRYEAYLMNEFQAKAIIFLALSPEARRQPRPELPELIRSLGAITSNRKSGIFLQPQDKAAVIALADDIRAAGAGEGRVELMQLALKLKQQVTGGGNLVSRSQIQRTVDEVAEHARNPSSTPDAARGELLLAAFDFIDAVGPSTRGYLSSEDKERIMPTARRLHRAAVAQGRKDIADRAHESVEVLEQRRSTQRGDMKELADRIGDFVRRAPAGRQNPPAKPR